MWCDLERPSGKPQLKLNYLFKREYLWDLAATLRGWYAQLRDGDTRSHLTKSHWPPSSPHVRTDRQTPGWHFTLEFSFWGQQLLPSYIRTLNQLRLQSEPSRPLTIVLLLGLCYAQLTEPKASELGVFWGKKMKSSKLSLLVVLMEKHLRKIKTVIGNCQCLMPFPFFSPWQHLQTSVGSFLWNPLFWVPVPM